MAVNKLFPPVRITYTDANGNRVTLYGWARVTSSHKKKSMRHSYFFAGYRAFVTAANDPKGDRVPIDEIRLKGSHVKKKVVKKKGVAYSPYKDEGGWGNPVNCWKFISIQWGFTMGTFSWDSERELVATGC